MESHINLKVDTVDFYQLREKAKSFASKTDLVALESKLNPILD
jgi:hypothetical protein